jgi:hypothetical protein
MYFDVLSDSQPFFLNCLSLSDEVNIKNKDNLSSDPRAIVNKNSQEIICACSQIIIQVVWKWSQFLIMFLFCLC